jgi:cytoskeleton protein RodZ
MFNPPPGPHSDGVETPPHRADVKEPPARPAPVPHMKAGLKLRAAREAQGLSLEHVAQKLMIRRDYLAALEAMNISLIPGSAYARAYLRSYVKFLGIADQDVVAQYESESARLREDADDQIRNPDSKPARERPWLAAIMLAVVCAAFVGWRAFHDRLIAEEPAPAAQVTAAAPAKSPAAVAPEAAAPVGEDPWGLAAQVVEIQATQPSWIEVRGPDGTIFLSKTMQPGERYKPDVGAGWTLHARDGGAFEVRLNGTSAGFLGEPGAPVLGRQVDKIAAPAIAGEG